MRIVIVGPGALGSLLTARISLFLETSKKGGAGNDYQLSLLDYKAERAERISNLGLVLEEGSGLKLSCHPYVTADPAVCEEADILFLCVKSPTMPVALARIRPFLSPDKLLVAMQNGIGHLQELAGLPCMCAVGVTSEGANLAGPGHVRHGGAGVTRLGLLQAESPSSHGVLDQVAALLNRAGLVAEVTTDPLKYVWAKLFVNVGINALTAINRCRNGELLASESIKEKMGQAVREAEQVARARNIPVDDDPVAVTFKVCETTRNNISSMHQDVRNKRPTEIDAINGAVVAEGERLGIPTPMNRELVRQIKTIEASYARTPRDSSS